MLEQMIAGNGFPKVVVENDHCRVFQMMGGTGDGSMTQYDLYPGITLMYNDFHMEDYDSDLTITGDLLCIDYCRQGRMEYPAGPDAYSYVEAGDLKLDRRLEHRGHFVFPLSHYHGITVGLELPRAAQALAEWVRDFPVDLYRLRDKYCSGPHYTITELSRRFSIPTTALKECFKSVYGQPINTYMRCLRMDRAALLLRQEPHAGVAEIAGRVGYDSASKFAAAFKAVKGKTPLEYRREGQ